MALEFKNLSVAYGSKAVIQDFSLNLEPGTIVSLLGRNGSGKSSILKSIFNPNLRRQGSICLGGKALSSYAPKERARKIAYLAQVHEIPGDITVKNLVSYGRYPHLRLGRRLSPHDEEVVAWAISRCHLEELSERRVSSLSGGERQRAWLAMAICQEPELLILDEPTTYLDVSYQMEVLQLVQSLNREQGMTILMVLHDLNLACRYSDLLVIIHDKNLACEGKSQDVLTPENLRQYFDLESCVLKDEIHNCPFFLPLDQEAKDQPERAACPRIVWYEN